MARNGVVQQWLECVPALNSSAGCYKSEDNSSLLVVAKTSKNLFGGCRSFVSLIFVSCSFPSYTHTITLLLGESTGACKLVDLLYSFIQFLAVLLVILINRLVVKHFSFVNIFFTKIPLLF
ncbi:Hypothetical predicted protein [Octopus vulgaris]|uniref:Uncharacterized protein n=1 Tax=Octopus vulgaris TaxID=6645 RepID=A0AA36FFW5_OCTVU|nr:Hypothetical predicted protein [Octopus vulgaris]